MAESAIVAKRAAAAESVAFNPVSNRIKARYPLPAQPKFSWSYRSIVKLC